jgi:hypothetical protein
MTNVNHNPANDFPIGSLGMDNADDTEGHVKRTLVGEADELINRVEEADTEGHVKRTSVGDAEELINRLEDDDTEGHVKF